MFSCAPSSSAGHLPKLPYCRPVDTVKKGGMQTNVPAPRKGIVHAGFFGFGGKASKVYRVSGISEWQEL